MNYQEGQVADLAPTEVDRRWGVVAACTVGLMLSQGTLLVYTFGVFVRPLTTEFGWSRTQVALGLALAQYAFAAALPFWGYGVDRFGARRLLLPGVVGLSALVASLALLTSSIWHYYLVFAASSVLGCACSPLGYCAVMVRRFDRHLGLALGLALMGVGIGAAVLPVLTQAMIAAFGWRGAYAGLGGLTLALTMPAALYATRGLPQPVRARSGAARIAVMKLVTSPLFLLMSTAFFLMGLVSIGALANFVPIMLAHGYAPLAAAQFASVIGITAIMGRAGVGWVMDHVHPPHVVVAVSLMGLMGLLLLAYAEGAAAAYTAALLIGMLVGAEVDFIAYFVRRYFGKAVFGQLYGVAFALFIIGVGTGPVLGSVSFDQFGSYRPGLLLLAAATLVITFIMLLLPVRKLSPGHGKLVSEASERPL